MVSLDVSNKHRFRHGTPPLPGMPLMGGSVVPRTHLWRGASDAASKERNWDSSVRLRFGAYLGSTERAT